MRIKSPYVFNSISSCRMQLTGDNRENQSTFIQIINSIAEVSCTVSEMAKTERSRLNCGFAQLGFAWFPISVKPSRLQISGINRANNKAECSRPLLEAKRNRLSRLSGRYIAICCGKILKNSRRKMNFYRGNVLPASINSWTTVFYPLFVLAKLTL